MRQDDRTLLEVINDNVTGGLGYEKLAINEFGDEYVNMHARLVAMDAITGRIKWEDVLYAFVMTREGLTYEQLLLEKELRDGNAIHGFHFMGGLGYEHDDESGESK